MSPKHLIGYGLLALVVGLITYFVTQRIVPLSIPPGPSPRAIQMRSPSTVVINVQPDSRLQGARFIKEPKVMPDGATSPSHLVISGPSSASPSIMTGISYILPLEQAAHIDALNAQLKKEEPLQAPLMFEFDPKSTASLYALLADARKKDPKATFVVTAICWYEKDGRHLLSTEQAFLKMTDY